MPAFATNKNVMCYINDIYVYLRARSTNALGARQTGEARGQTGGIRQGRGCLHERQELRRGATIIRRAHPILMGAAICIGIALAVPVRAQTDNNGEIELVDPHTLRVCADPHSLPFSNTEGEGFENKIAALIAQNSTSPWLTRSIPTRPDSSATR